ncbi:hypothetical protein [Thermus scotoductus]|nr:hypothetical protein [Thermus scotoductus]
MRGALAAGSARVSEMVASLPSPLQNRFHQAKALLHINLDTTGGLP